MVEVGLDSVLKVVSWPRCEISMFTLVLLPCCFSVSPCRVGVEFFVDTVQAVRSCGRDQGSRLDARVTVVLCKSQSVVVSGSISL